MLHFIKSFLWYMKMKKKKNKIKPTYPVQEEVFTAILQKCKLELFLVIKINPKLVHYKLIHDSHNIHFKKN